jgi:hypothetical protein
MTITLSTRGWKPWLYCFRLVLPVSGEEATTPLDYVLTQNIAPAFEPLDARNLALKVPAPDDRLAVEVSDSWGIAEGTHAQRMCRTTGGLILHGDRYSEDEGATWRQRNGRSSGWCELRSRKIIGIAGAPQPVDGREGWYETELIESDDEGRTTTARPALFHVPQAKAAMGHARHSGPLYMGSIVERDDGSLLALMAGWFKGDDEICPYGHGRPYSRTYVCESFDGGGEWSYLATIGYDRIGSEGYNEGTFRRLPDGDLLVVMRTGSMVSDITQDNPIMMSRSEDGGRTWAKPWRTGANGAYPNLLVLSDGMLALSSGRPGAFIMFSNDRGATWADRCVVDATPYSGYTSMVELAPRTILCAYGAKNYIDPESGETSNVIRLVRITYREAEPV